MYRHQASQFTIPNFENHNGTALCHLKALWLPKVKTIPRPMAGAPHFLSTDL
jgi:hypothetical protein